MLPLFLLLQGCVIKEKRSANDSEAIKSFLFVPFCRAKQSPANPSCTSSWKTKRRNKRRENENERKMLRVRSCQMRWPKFDGGRRKGAAAKSRNNLFFSHCLFFFRSSLVSTLFSRKRKNKRNKIPNGPPRLIGEKPCLRWTDRLFLRANVWS